MLCTEREKNCLVTGKLKKQKDRNEVQGDRSRSRASELEKERKYIQSIIHADALQTLVIQILIRVDLLKTV